MPSKAYRTLIEIFRAVLRDLPVTTGFIADERERERIRALTRAICDLVLHAPEMLGVEEFRIRLNRSKQ
jgi:hypothetical protein